MCLRFEWKSVEKVICWRLKCLITCCFYMFKWIESRAHVWQALSITLVRDAFWTSVKSMIIWETYSMEISFFWDIISLKMLCESQMIHAPVKKNWLLIYSNIKRSNSLTSINHERKVDLHATSFNNKKNETFNRKVTKPKHQIVKYRIRNSR